MLKLSTKILYGLRAAITIAQNEGAPLSAKEISISQGIPEQYLEQILVKLRKAGILVSVRGPGGGYKLSRPPQEISIYEIAVGLEGPIGLAKCLDPEEDFECDRKNNCIARLVWSHLQEQIENTLKNLSLKQVLVEAKEQGIIEPLEPEIT